MALNQIADREQYSPDKPKSCEYCFFWKGKRFGCGLGSCRFLISKEPEQRENVNEICCDGCPYGKYSPCIGYCLMRIMRELKVGRYAE